MSDRTNPRIYEEVIDDRTREVMRFCDRLWEDELTITRLSDGNYTFRTDDGQHHLVFGPEGVRAIVTFLTGGNPEPTS